MPSFLTPLWFLSIPPLLYLLWRMQRQSFAEGTPVLQRTWFVIRSILMVLLVFALASFQLRTGIKQNQILFLMDFSESISPEQRERAMAWINQSVRKIHAPDQVGFIVFGANATIERFPTKPHPFHNPESLVDGAATNLENAARLAEALFTSNYQKNIVILSDGMENAGKADEFMAQLREKGITTQGVHLQPSDHTEAVVERVRVPDEIRLKETFHLDAVLSSNRRTPALLQVFRNGALVQEGTVMLDASRKELLRLPQKLTEPGIYRYQIKLNPKEDFRAENNSLEAWVSVQGPPRILLVDKNPKDLVELQSALVNRGFQVDLKPAQQFPLTLEEMFTYQSIFIRNVSASRIHHQMPLIRQYVHDFGGGFAMIGGDSSFGPGGYYQTPVEEILPVRMDLVNKKYLADVAMVIVIDKSGSMSFADRGRQKIDLADEGGARVASLLQKTDQLGVLAVDSVPKWAFPLQRLTNLNAAINAITSIRAGGGGIYVYSGLHEAFTELKETKASVKHVILFADTADCEEKEGPSGEPSLMLAQSEFRDHKITTTTIGIGQTGDIDVEFLRQLAVIGGGRFYFTNDMFTLPEIFAQESMIVQRYYINEERFTPLISEIDPLLSGIGAIPDLLGYVATSAKHSSGTALLSHREDPVLSFWRHGLGHTVAFTSDPTRGWGAFMLDWPEYERFWAQVTRYMTRNTLPPHFKTSSTASGNHTMIIVEAFDEQGTFLNNAEFRGMFVDGSGRQYEIRFLQTAPGRYEAGIHNKGSLFGKIFRLESQGILEEAVVQVAGTTNREYEVHRNGRDRLLQLTGKVVDSPDQLRFSNQVSEEIQPLQKRLLLLAALLFLLDVAVRKIDFKAIRLQEKRVTSEPASTPSPIAQLMATKRPRTLELPFQDLPDEPVKAELNSTVTEAPLVEPSQYMQRLKEAKKRK